MAGRLIKAVCLKDLFSYVFKVKLMININCVAEVNGSSANLYITVCSLNKLVTEIDLHTIVEICLERKCTKLRQ